MTDLVFVHPSDERYGADRMLRRFLQALPTLDGVEVWLPQDLAHPELSLCTVLQQDGVRVRHLDLPILRRAYQNPRGLARLAVRSRLLWRELRSVRPKHVYLTTSAAFLGAPTARAAGVPRVTGHLQEIWAGREGAVLGHLGRACHDLVAISESVQESMPEHLRRRTTVVLNGTEDPGDINLLDGRSGPLEFVVASRWNRWKGHGTLLEAWDIASDPGRLVVLGGPPPSGDRFDVPERVARLGDPGSVEIVGEVADIAPYIDHADVLVIPSDDPEPFGLVAIEAMAHGRPVIASNGGGLREIVTDGLDGWLFPAGDRRALAALLDSLGRDDVAAAGLRARQTFERRFDIDRLTSDWRRTVLRA